MLGWLQFHGALKPRDTWEILGGGCWHQWNLKEGAGKQSAGRRKEGENCPSRFFCTSFCGLGFFSPSHFPARETVGPNVREDKQCYQDAVLERLLLWANIWFSSYYSSHRQGFVNGTEIQRKYPVPCEFKSTLSKRRIKEFCIKMVFKTPNLHIKKENMPAVWFIVRLQ